ncbi:hypothetical protein SEA_IZZY_45 [Streptomyces phage Izzy]|uniref:Uncharacterized protein n=6 Tax=Likavirus izzy TaxID=1982888 RepID=A0A2U8UTM8_9CAUD|nr:hypothetical protein AVT27_gp45 [Streptomyces phage Izzy]ATE84998.1 hypothetical protein SEA_BRYANRECYCLES_45 [Streptomyces phage BryanRecycles]ATE85299.1 hypothetical protein SEA_JASH_45 [Streptomyces phage Jash]ATE85375.1 hypothetical protein SEA_OLIYNYK_45 [Streptomyces phage Oliynyk]AWN07488.1 hypothetical protein SEA_EDDASA_45 [Streptomyces phage Eddasa]QDK03976.1 hypothetical protein SEA_RUSTICUS_45 [Streptomyces phage Rusticus]
MNIIDIETEYDSAEQAVADWSLVSGDPNDPTVYDTALFKAARKMVREYGNGTVDYDDLVQDGYIVLAMKAQSMRRAYAEGGEGLLVTAIHQRLTNCVATDVRRSNKRASLDSHLEGRQ